MAKVIFSGIGVTEARNKLGGGVFSRNRGGSFIREYSSPVVNPNDFGLQMRASFGDACATWQLMPPFVQDSWNQFASAQASLPSNLGRKKLSGFNWFVKQNIAIILYGGTPTFMPVVPSTPAGAASFSAITCTPAAIELKATSADGSTVLPSDVTALVGASLPVSPGITNLRHRINLLYQILPGDDFSSVNITTEYLDMYGSIPSGLRIFFKIVPVNIVCGMRGMPVFCNAIVE